MINKFEKQLEKWNGGVLRGAQAKLARLLRVSTATVALWATGKRRPSKGYATQMAQLFGLDAYDVMRLFSPTTTYPDLTVSSPALHDAQEDENTYKADCLETLNPQSNSVSLPFLAQVPATTTTWNESDILEWWTLPRRSAKGAKYLISLGDPRALYFIRPTQQLEDQKLMLVRVGNQPYILRAKKQAGEFVFYTENALQPSYLPHLPEPLGVVVQKLEETI